MMHHEHPEVAMKKLVIAMIAAASATVCWADALHGYCQGVGQCIDNGTNSPSTGTPINFGFTIGSGPTTGTLLLDLLGPDNEAHAASYAITGTASGTATLFSATPWTSGQLDAYLGLSASPTKPIGADLPSTQALDPGATGFLVFQVNLGTVTLQSPSNPNISPLLNISPDIPLASYLVGFFDDGGRKLVATANSGAIFVTNGSVPEPSSVILLVSMLGLVGRGLYKRACRG
jgi:hypothetical protein